MNTADRPSGQGAKGVMRISRAAEASGVSKQSIQYYIMLGLLEPAGRTPAGHQLFDEASLDRIRMIRQLNDSGYPLREIRDIFLKRGDQR